MPASTRSTSCADPREQVVNRRVGGKRPLERPVGCFEASEELVDLLLLDPLFLEAGIVGIEQHLLGAAIDERRLVRANRVLELPLCARLVRRAVFFLLRDGRPHAAPEQHDRDVALGRHGQRTVDGVLRREARVHRRPAVPVVPAHDVDVHAAADEGRARQAEQQLADLAAGVRHVAGRGEEDSKRADCLGTHALECRTSVIRVNGADGEGGGKHPGGRRV